VVRAAGDNESSRTPELLTSRENRWLKLFRAALAGETRADAASGDVSGIEGVRIVETALHSGAAIVAVLVSETGAQHLPELAPYIPPDAKLLQTTDRLFSQVAATETPQGVAALVRPRVATFDDLVCGTPLILMLAGVQDPGNVGGLIRTAEAFGATGVVACSAGGIGTANPFAPKALRASAGSALRVPVLRGVSAPVLLAQLRVAGVKAYAACPDAGVNKQRTPLAPWELDWRAPVALLVGNEGAGLSPDLVRSADQIVRIPQAAARDSGAPMDSLNAAIAGAVLLYEAARQRGLR
jgi:TrmH family RNA methyltransferase